ncbi:hypothetical protein E2C01_059639 [Portunus trituberculatus]|uniref:Uncharacterized protein n=1 Tax=Portunus trituberculatus TaxID=210409 RepID=A0A5B7H9L5_PORTR|nr:hypothetical protein [Portunus trituberculatus]
MYGRLLRPCRTLLGPVTGTIRKALGCEGDAGVRALVAAGHSCLMTCPECDLACRPARDFLGTSINA